MAKIIVTPPACKWCDNPRVTKHQVTKRASGISYTYRCGECGRTMTLLIRATDDPLTPELQSIADKVALELESEVEAE